MNRSANVCNFFLLGSSFNCLWHQHRELDLRFLQAKLVHLARLSSSRLVSPNKREKVLCLLPCVEHTSGKLWISGSIESWAHSCQVETGLLGEPALPCAHTHYPLVELGILQLPPRQCCSCASLSAAGRSGELSHFIGLTGESCLAQAGCISHSDMTHVTLHWFIW